MAKKLAIGAVLLGALLLPAGPAPAQLAAPETGYRLVAEYPHDDDAFTQGLEFRGTRLFESTGLEGRSTLRRVDLATGQVKRRVSLSDRHFGEGMTIFDDRLYWLTWKSEKAFVYDPATFKRLRRYVYAREGWGLTHNARSLIMSNGSSKLIFRDPKNFSIRRRVTVRDGAEEIERLNELEWVNGEVFANVWQTDRIARIDPSDGRVTGWIDIRALHEDEEAQGDPDVANGIAYIPSQDRLFVTGKFWKHIYEIELSD